MTCQDHELLNEIEILKKRLIDLETQLQSEKQKQSESLEGLAVQKNSSN